MTQLTARKRIDHIGEIPAPETARDRLIKAATALFFRYGINATGVDAIVEAAGTAKATLYKSFGSKEGLVEAVLEARGNAWRDDFTQALALFPGDARAKLVGIFDILGEWFTTEAFYGCPFTNAVGEFDKRDAHYKRLALVHKRVIIDHIERLAEEGGLRDAHDVACQLCMLVDGAIACALINNDAKVAQTARAAALKIVAAS